MALISIAAHIFAVCNLDSASAFACLPVAVKSFTGQG